MNEQGMPSLLMQAAHSAAQADGLAPPPPDSQTSSGNKLEQHDTNNATAAMANMNNNSGGAGNNKAAMAAAAAAAQQQMAQQQQQQQQRQAMQQQQQQQQSGGGGGGKKKGLPLRRGKWTPEEEAYANRLIQEFKAGLLPLTDGTTLRTFLSKLLNCDPMRISKKFVGSNCIGKQVFRRKTADLNRLTPDQIQKSRAELNELERRFLERVAQTNRVKSTNSSSSNNNNNNAIADANHNGGGAAAVAAMAQMNGMRQNAAAAFGGMMGMNDLQNGGGLGNDNSGVGSNNPMMDFAAQNPAAAAAALNHHMMGGGFNAGGMGQNQQQPPSPPWMQPPLGYKQGMGAQMAAANLAGGQHHANSRAAAAGRALLGGLNPGNRKNSGNNNNNNNNNNNSGNNNNNNNNGNNPNASLLAMAELHRHASQQALMNAAARGSSAQDLLAALGGSSQSLAQMARNASAARLGSFANGNSFNNLMLKTGFSRDQLSQLARERGLSSASLSNMVERKNSFDALMSLDFQSLQSIDNLANLMQTGQGQVPSNGMKNWSADGATAGANQQTSSASLSQAARRLASAGNLESFMRSLSNNNMSRGAGLKTEDGNGSGGSGSNGFAGFSQSSNTNLQNLLQNMSNGNIARAGGSGGGNASMSSLLGAANANGASAASLANLFRDQSTTGLSALRMQDGLNNRNTSVEDFLSLVAAGDIPHQDPSLLNLPLSQLQQQQQQSGSGGGSGEKSREGGDAAAMLAQQQAFAQATGNAALANALASRSFGNLGGLEYGGSGNLNSLGSTAELLQQMAGTSTNSTSFNNMKRKLLEVEGDTDSQGASKR